MPSREINDAEVAFFGALQEDGLHKAAVDLSPETVDGLGIQSVSPSTLDQLEDQAAQVPESEPEPEPEPEPAPEATELEAYNRTDAPPEEEAVPEPELPSRATHGKLFSDKRAHPIQILDVLTMRYGPEWPRWEPETLWWSLRRDFGPVGDLSRNKIAALRIAVSTDVPWLDWDVFEDCGLSWNDITPVIGAFQPMTPMQTAFAVHILRSIRPDEEFTHEVKAYIAAILDEHGFVYAPEEFFDGAQELLDRKDWLAGLKADVADAWERIREMSPEDIDWNHESPMDLHLLKLFVVQSYLQEREALRQAIPGMPAASSTVSPPVP